MKTNPYIINARMLIASLFLLIFSSVPSSAEILILSGNYNIPFQGTINVNFDGLIQNATAEDAITVIPINSPPLNLDIVNSGGLNIYSITSTDDEANTRRLEFNVLNKGEVIGQSYINLYILPPTSHVFSGMLFNNIAINSEHSFDIAGKLYNPRNLPYTVEVTGSSKVDSVSVNGSVINYRAIEDGDGYIEFNIITKYHSVEGRADINIVGPLPPVISQDISMEVDWNTKSFLPISRFVSGEYDNIDITYATQGTAAIEGNQISFTPNVNETGSAEINYMVNYSGGSIPGRIIVEISSPPPITMGTKTYDVLINESFTLDLDELVENNGLPYTPFILSNTGGTYSLNGNSIEYFPNATGPQSITIVVFSNGSSDTNTVYFNVAHPLPVVENYSMNIGFGVPMAVNIPSFIKGDYTDIEIISATKGTASFEGNYNIRYTQNLTEYGPAEILYVVRSPAGDVSGRIDINIGAPASPVITEADMTVPFNAANSFNLQYNISGYYTGVEIVSASKGVATINGTNVTYTVNANEVGNAEITYVVKSLVGDVTGKINVTIGNPPLPVVTDGNMSVPFNGSNSVDVSSNISGYYTDIEIVAASKGVATINGTNITYNVNANEVGNAEITYVVKSPIGDVNGSVSVSITPPDLPIVTDSSMIANFNQSNTIDIGSNITGFYDSIIIASTEHGVATINGTVVTYTPNQDSIANDEIIYTVKSQVGDVNGKITVTMNTPPLPVVENYSMNIGFGIPMAVNTPAFIKGYYTDIEIVSATKGRANFEGNYNIRYSQDLKEYGIAEIVYLVKSPAGNVNGLITIDIGAPALPVVTDTNMIVPFNTTERVSVSPNISGYYTDIEIVSASKGVATINGRIVTYTPNDGEMGAAEILYVVRSLVGDVNGKIIVDIQNPTLPVVTDGNMSVPFNSSNSVNVSSNISGYYTGVEIVSASKGVATIDGTNITYTANENELGNAEILYVVKSPIGDVNGKISVNITLPPLPVITDAKMTVDFNTFNSVDVASNITGFYEAITIKSAQHGVATIDGTVITYTPNKDSTSNDEIIYTVKSPSGDVDGKVLVEIGVPDVPTIPNESVSVLFNENGSLDLASIIPAGYTEISTANANNGTVKISGSVITYTPNKDYFGPDTITYVAKYPQGDANGLIDVTVKEPDAPTANIPQIEVIGNDDASVDIASYISGYYDSISIFRNPTLGTASLNGSILNYVYNKANTTATTSSMAQTTTDAVGNDLIDIVGIRLISAGRTYDFDVQFNIKVEENLLPIAKDHNINIIHNGEGNVDVATGAVNGPFTRVAIVQGTNAGDVTISGMDVSFKSNIGFQGSTSVRYVIYNEYGASEAKTITFSVGDRPDLTKDEEIIGLMTAQQEAADKFARNQIENFNSRMERIRSETGEYREDDISDITMNFGQNEQDLSDPATIHDQNSGTLSIKDFVKPREWNTKKGYKPYSYWLTGEIGFGDLNRDKGIKYNSVGFTGGVDYRFTPEFVAGIGFGYSRDKVDVGNNGTDLVSKGYAVAAYATYHPTDGIFIDGVIGYSWLDYKTKRFVTPTGDFAYGDRSGNQVFGSVTAGYDFKQDNVTFTPYVRIEGAYTKLDPFTEHTDTPYAATFGKQTSSFVSGVVGAKIEYQIQTGYGVVRPYVRAEYSHDLKGTSKGKVGYADIGEMAPVNIRGDKRKTAKIGVGVDMDLRNQWKIGGEYTLETGSGQNSHTFSIKLKYEF